PSSSGQGVFALRNDLNSGNTSSNFVLLKFRNPTNSEWQFRLYQTVLSDATHGFTFSDEAGKEILPPYPLSLLSACPHPSVVSGKALRDQRGKFYASMGPTPAVPNPQIRMRYSYPLQPDFYFDRNGDGTSDVPIGTCIGWDGIPPGAQTASPIDVTYRIRWP